MRLIDADELSELLAIVAKKMAKSDAQKALMERVFYILEHRHEEVVRCKNCRFCRTFFPEKQIGKEARRVWYCDLYRCNRKADEYCSDGERREEGNNGC